MLRLHKLFRRVASGLRMLRLAEFAVAKGNCPFCGPTLFLKLNADEGGVRCLRCAASTVHLSIGVAIKKYCPTISNLDVCELSSQGPLVDFLRAHAHSTSFSEYQSDVTLGTVLNGVRCEDVQNLTYANSSFDLITHTEIMEHVPDDQESYRELRRVLRTGGLMIFTVPLSENEETQERARLVKGIVEYFLEQAYHTDPWREGEGVLVYRDYGMDIIKKIESSGFSQVLISNFDIGVPWIRLRPVVIAPSNPFASPPSRMTSVVSLPCSTNGIMRHEQEFGRRLSRGEAVRKTIITSLKTSAPILVDRGSVT